MYIKNVEPTDNHMEDRGRIEAIIDGYELQSGFRFLIVNYKATRDYTGGVFVEAYDSEDVLIEHNLLNGPGDPEDNYDIEYLCSEVEELYEEMKEDYQ